MAYSKETNNAGDVISCNNDQHLVNQVDKMTEKGLFYGETHIAHVGVGNQEVNRPVDGLLSRNTPAMSERFLRFLPVIANPPHDNLPFATVPGPSPIRTVTSPISNSMSTSQY